MRFSALRPTGTGKWRRAVLRDVLRRTGRQLQVLNGNIVGISVAGLGIGEHPHADAIGGRLRAVFDQSLFQTDSLVSPVFEIKIGIVRFFPQSGAENFFQIAVLQCRSFGRKMIPPVRFPAAI